MTLTHVCLQEEEEDGSVHVNAPNWFRVAM